MAYKCSNCDEPIETHTEGDVCPVCGFHDIREDTEPTTE